ncbi:hypothetical protein C1T31_05310 [Hanstruepera neustonica]|uniref:Uncharacterized protein n=1 Tax=Hanstruepera neustonica TaxID=1445657 RepID=A0A2K1E0H8_9FLAO|nr:DUF6090 family protein [Hanstruepera neustonica]PNQ73754.1 hypothetical protein C1T31_05310 [Hanstruepera neustonica]
MIKLFRNIRKNLLNEGKTSKYFKYAIGEIVLVVIGILIALQINNINEAKNNEARFKKILKELRKDLETDILNSEPLLKDNLKVDSLSNLVLDHKFTKDDYLEKGSRNLFWVGLQFSPFDYQKTAFKKFESFQGVVPAKYDSIIKDINHYYIDLGQFYDDIYGIFRERINDHHSYLVNNTNWYYKMRNGETTDEMIDFYLNNPMYKNWVSQYQMDNTAGKYGTLKMLQSRGFGLLQKLTETIGDSYEFKDEDILNKYGKPIANANEYVGEYKNLQTNNTTRIQQIGGHLFEGYNTTGALKEIKRDTFLYIDYPDWQNIFTRDADGRVNGMKLNHLKDSTRNSSAIKIK